jgi:dTDP-4-dehydrorhamnose reductase
VKVLIAGANGQVGRALSASMPIGAKVVALARADLDIVAENQVSEQVRQHRPELIINAAAYTAVDRAEDEVDAARGINEKGVLNLARAAKEVGARLIHLSTDFVFDGQSSQPYRPHDPTNPLSVYGATKRDGERAVLATLPERSVIVRTAWVYAPQGANFLRTMLRVMGANGSVRVVSDQIGTPTSALSLAETIWQIAARADLKGIHHWTDAGVASWYDFAVAIAEEGAALGLLPSTIKVIPITTEEYPTRARRPRFSVLDKRSLISAGCAPVHWRENLRVAMKELQRA